MALSLKYFQKEISDEADFFHVGKHYSFLYVYTYILSVLAKACPKYSSNNFAIISCAIYQEIYVRDEVDFLPASKHQSFLQVDTIIFGVDGQACPKFPK